MVRRSSGRETWTRLLEWDQGSASAERLAAKILESEGFSSIDPSHPLGGPDGGRDIECVFNGAKWIGAVYFPRGQKNFTDIKDKLQHDIEGAQKHNPYGIIFITNQEITISERYGLKEIVPFEDFRLYHLEGIANILDTPKMYGVRLEFLDIEMTKEEQLACFTQQGNKLQSIDEKLDQLCMAIKSKNIFEEGSEGIRSFEEVVASEEEFYEKMWFDRHQVLKHDVESGIKKVKPEIWEDALKAEKIMIDKYGEENLGPYSDFEWGMLNGKLSALRWVLGADWDMLDT